MSTPAPLQAQTDVRFATNVKPGNFGLAIVGDVGVYSDGNIHLLLLPNVPATIVADVGKIILGASREYEVPGGILQFSNSASSSLPVAPMLETPQFKTLFAFDSEGQNLGVNGVGASWDADSQQVRLSRAMTGAVRYSKYKTTAQAFAYQPETQALGQGTSTTYGVICAHHLGTIVIHEVQPPTIDRGNAMIELYRRFDYKVTNRDGQFEKPPNYPASGAYPPTASAPGASLVIEVDGSNQVERVWEIGYIDEQGRGWVQTPNVSILEPYVGIGSYSPTIACTIASLDPEKYPPELIARAQDFIKSKNLGCKG